MADSAGMRRPRRRIPLLLVVAAVLCFSTLAPQLIYGATDPTDTAALRGLMNDLKGTPSSWGRSDDPCSSWEGIVCSDSRVTIIKLSSMGLQGTLSSDIAQLSELQILDLSFNPNLGGPLTRNIENLKKLTTLILMSCSFGGPIPPELGNLSELTFIALNSNKFTGTIPGSLGKLSKVYWLDLADNQLTGSLPLSSGTSTPGLNMLTHTKHFHFNKNQLSGTIPPDFFSPGMSLIHVLFDSNKFTGSIPDSIGLVTTLEVLRLDRNQLSGGVPSTIGNLSKVTELNLANNKLTGVLPDLSGMSSLNYVDLSNNTFSPSGAPKWFSDLPLTTLVIESAGLTGQIPASVFGNFQLQQVLLRRNHINGTLDIRGTISPQLQRVDMRDNEIMYITEGIGKQITIILIGNPICKNQVTGNYCLLRDEASTPYSTSLVICQGTTCYQGQSLNPSVCKCAYPYEGIMIFRAPSFSDLSNASRFQNLEQSLWTKLGLQPGSVFIANPFFNSDNYIELQVKLFPTDTLYFNRTEIQRLGFMFSNQTYKPPKEFGPYVFQALEYPFIDKSNQKKTVNTAVIAGIAVACFVLVMILIVVGLYAFKQKKKADRAAELSRPFASWAPSGRETGGGAPQLKGARWFSFDDVKKSTNNFSDGNEIGSGGYGKVYRGTLPTGQLVAIKRATQGSIQGGVEFKTEVELLSRVHHKNLVALVGFCFEQGEQMLVYEYIPNGTLRENLVGKTGIILDWKKRLRIALGSARGLAYLHELADPPIIHRDVKSSNILLDESLNAKVADFGLSKLISDCEKGHVSTQVKGTMGYLDPEYYMTQQLTDKSDVYSLGVVLLELLTAKLPIEKGKYIVREIKSALRTDDEERFGLSEFMDPVLRDSPTLMGLGHFIDVALKCVDDSAPNRPTMSDVVKELEVILQHDGSNPSSASSSATRFGLGKGPRDHPYNEPLPKTESYEYGSGAFDSSSGFVIPATLQPK